LGDCGKPLRKSEEFLGKKIWLTRSVLLPLQSARKKCGFQASQKNILKFFQKKLES